MMHLIVAVWSTAERGDVMIQRHGQYYYSSFAGRLPTGTLLAIIVGATMPLTFFATVPDHLWIMVIHFAVTGGLVTVGPRIMPWLRQRGMQRAANTLDFSYEWKTSFGWLPPDYEYCPDSVECFNMLRGEFGGRSVLVFDSRITRTSTRRRNDGRTVTRRTTRNEYNVVQLKGRDELPTFLLASAGYCGQPSVPIPSTEYRLFSPSNPSDTPVEQAITDDVVEFLRQTPGWVIEVRGRQLTVFDDRTFSARCRVPGNVPAFVADVSRLHDLLADGVSGGGTHDSFSIERALEQQAAEEVNAGFFGTRLTAMHHLQSDQRIGAITSFGFLWTVMTLVFFALAFTTSGMNQEPVLFVLGPLFLLIGLGLLVPGALDWLSRRSREVSEPTVHATGDQPSAGKSLRIRFQQRNNSVAVMPDVSVCVNLSQRVFKNEQSRQRAGAAGRQPDVQSSDWQRGCEVKQTFHIGNLPPGETIKLTPEFMLPSQLKRQPAGCEWWGIDTTTTSDDRTVWAATYYLPQPDLMRLALVIPAVVFGVVWGFFGMGVLGAAAFDALRISAAGPMFGILGVGIFGGAIGGGALGYYTARQIVFWPLIRSLAPVVGRMNLGLQLFGSGVLAMATFFFGFYLVDDVYDLFGWQSKAVAAPTESVTELRLAEKPDESSAPDQSLSRDQAPRGATLSVDQFRKAVVTGNLPAMQRLAAADPQLVTAVVTPVGGTALHQACVHNQVAAARWLIEHGARINAKNRHRSTPLHIGAFHGHLPVVRVLVKHGANLSIRNRPGHTAEQRARQRGHHTVAGFLNQAATETSK